MSGQRFDVRALVVAARSALYPRELGRHARSEGVPFDRELDLIGGGR